MQNQKATLEMLMKSLPADIRDKVKEDAQSGDPGRLLEVLKDAHKKLGEVIRRMEAANVVGACRDLGERGVQGNTGKESQKDSEKAPDSDSSGAGGKK